jgi:hypothetical protein
MLGAGSWVLEHFAQTGDQFVKTHLPERLPRALVLPHFSVPHEAATGDAGRH